MRRFLLIFVLFSFSLNFYAQLDTEHWFAPMVDRTGNANQVQRVYMSTNETIPFKVDIYNNNVVIGSVTISKNNPQYYEVARSYIIATTQSDLFKPVTKGLYLKGEKPFFASLRFSVQQHGEILTSKGNAGIGTEFRTVMAPITVNNSILNFMTSVMATQDNTSVTVSGFSSGLRFSDNVTRTQFTFTLNKGQSYLIDGSGYYSQNWQGFIGAKIVADKPITITNGNFNGQYAGNYSNSSDILMDQGVPVNKLGQEFVLMKGNGTTTSGMEKAIIVATENGTQVFLNNNPVAVATLNAGQYYETPGNAYLPKGSNHYNMYIKTTKNAYVYQLLAGTDDYTNSIATGGFNYIPPLSCYLPKKIDEIGMIDQNRVYLTSTGWKDAIPTKLNIITEKNATIDVKRNGFSLTLTSANGPFNVTGNDSWVTYSIPNITGNIAVYSSSAVTAGISAGDAAVGYGGYFAGFSYIPAIVRSSGECVPDAVLELTEGFDQYKWMYRDKDGTVHQIKDVSGTTPGANTISPTEPGYYWAVVKQGSCDPVTTPELKFYTCLDYSMYNFVICEPKVIIPEFSLSNQNIASVSLTVPPSQGNVVIDPTTHVITYTPNAGATGTDSFRYKLVGNDPTAPENEEFLINIDLQLLTVNDTQITECATGGNGIFNLTTASVTSDAGATIEGYFTTESGAQNNTDADLIPNPGAYPSAGGVVYVRVKSAAGCIKTPKIELNLYPYAQIDVTAYNFTHCVDLSTGHAEVTLSDVTAAILSNPTYFQIRYYTTPAQANAGTTPGLSGTWTYTADTTLYMRIDSPDGCPPVIVPLPFKIGTKLPLITSALSKPICDNNANGTVPVNLLDYITEFYATATAANVKFYNTAGSEVPPNQNIAGDTTFTIQFTVAGYCDNIGTLNLMLRTATPSAVLDPEYFVCQGDTKVLDAGPGFEYYKWYNIASPTVIIAEGANAHSITVGAGNYRVELTSASGCIYKQNVKVTGKPIAVPNTAAFNGMRCDDNFDGIIEVKFSTEVTPVLLSNASLYTVKYYSNAAHTQLLPDEWSYTTATTVYMEIKSEYCPTVYVTLQFGFGNLVPLLKNTDSAEECTDDLNGNRTVNLASYKNRFTTDNSVTAAYFNSQEDARKNENTISPQLEMSGTRTFYIRFSKNGFCADIATFTLSVIIPKQSEVLKDTTSCPGKPALLDAGPGFDYYKWSTGQEGPNMESISVPPGEYWVDLTSGICIYRQHVKVIAVDLPVITAIEVNGDTATITVEGGNPPYQYSSDGINYQPTNILTNLKYGKNTVYVLSADGCDPVTQDFTVIRILNVITPNGDGYNDVLDYSDLSLKEDVLLKVFNRSGNVIFTGDKSSNSYKWDGKNNGRPVNTGTYWYVLQWRDPGSARVLKQTGWILVKNE